MTVFIVIVISILCLENAKDLFFPPSFLSAAAAAATAGRRRKRSEEMRKESLLSFLVFLSFESSTFLLFIYPLADDFDFPPDG